MAGKAPQGKIKFRVTEVMSLVPATLFLKILLPVSVLKSTNESIILFMEAACSCVPPGIKINPISMGRSDIILITAKYKILAFLELCLQKVKKNMSRYWLYSNY